MNVSQVCVDASLIVRLFVGPDDAEAWERWDGWLKEGRSIHAPALLGYETANAFYRYHRAGFISLASAEVALDAALALPVRLEADGQLHRVALRLAAELGLAATCDAHYLALAEQLDADLWTADARFAREAGSRRHRIRVLGAEEPSG